MNRIMCSKTNALRILKSDKKNKYKKITYCPVLGVSFLYPKK